MELHRDTLESDNPNCFLFLLTVFVLVLFTVFPLIFEVFILDKTDSYNMFWETGNKKSPKIRRIQQENKVYKAINKIQSSNSGELLTAYFR